MLYISTRSKDVRVSGAQAILSGMADDGGLFVPAKIPRLSQSDFEKLLELDYSERVAFIMGMFLPEFSYEQLLSACRQAYSRFEGDPAPLIKIDSKLYMLELWHGPTHAFKDMALTVLPHLINLSKDALGAKETTYILVATSGDTGKAALEGFRDVKGTAVKVFYPQDGVSPMQRLQMVTQEGENVAVTAVKGNFDDCQSAVKTVFADQSIAQQLSEQGYALSSANSINWGRLLPQIAYYVSAYLDLVGEGQLPEGEKVNFCVPTGNFGNILAGYYAKQMGVPIAKLLCASNSNNVLTDFFNKAEYSTKREFIKTISPSMDILISSNLERLIFEFSGRDASFTADCYAQLKEKGAFSVTEEQNKAMTAHFYAAFADEDSTIETVQDFFELYNYPLDPHTGVAVSVYNKYREYYQDSAKTIIVSTANPYKFPQDVLFSITGDYCGDSFRAAKKLYKVTAMEIPQNVLDLKAKPVRFKHTVTPAEIAREVLAVPGN